MRRGAAIAGVMMALGAVARGGPVQGPPPTTTPVMYHAKYALCIGIDHYPAQGEGILGDLKFAEADARAVADRLSGDFGFEPRVLLGADATRAGILGALDEISRKAGADDAVVIFYSGHGLQKTWKRDDLPDLRAGFLVPEDGNRKVESNTIDAYQEQMVGMNELCRQAVGMKARHVVIVLDCCFSGFAGLTRGAADDHQADVTQYAQLMANPSRLAITAGTEDQPSFEPDGYKNGLFTTGLLAALKDQKDKPVSATELFVDVRRQVLKFCSEVNYELDPQLRPLRTNKGEFVLVPGEAGAWKDELSNQSFRPAGTTTEDQQRVAKGVAAVEDDHQDLQDDPKWQERRKEYEERAAAGDEAAMALVHYCYRYGLGCKRDDKRAYKWANEASDTKSPVGMAILAQCFAAGIGTPANPKTAGKLNSGVDQRTLDAIAKIGSGKKLDAGDWTAIGISAGASKKPGAGLAPGIVDVFTHRPVDKTTETHADAEAPAEGAYSEQLQQVADAREKVLEKIADAQRYGQWRPVQQALDRWRDSVTALQSATLASRNADKIGKLCGSMVDGIEAVREKVDKTLPKGAVTKVRDTDKDWEQLRQAAR